LRVKPALGFDPDVCPPVRIPDRAALVVDQGANVARLKSSLNNMSPGAAPAVQGNTPISTTATAAITCLVEILIMRKPIAARTFANLT
jgi:hypothetical protein